MSLTSKDFPNLEAWRRRLLSVLPNAKGMLLTSDGSTLRRLGSGADGLVLVLDSADALGVKWAEPGELARVFQEGIIVGANNLTTGVLEIHGRNTTPPATKHGGQLWLTDENDANGFYIHVDRWDDFFISDVPGGTDYIHIDKGAPTITLGGDLALTGFINWTITTDGTAAARLDPIHVTTTPAVGDHPFSSLVKQNGDQFTYHASRVRVPGPTNEEGEFVWNVACGSLGLLTLFGIIGDDPNTSIEIRDGTRLSLDGAPSATPGGAASVQGTTYFLMNGTSLELWVKGVLTQTWTAGGGGGSGDSFLEWGGL